MSDVGSGVWFGSSESRDDTRRCHFCGEPSEWGWYKIDGHDCCDRCGDLLLTADEIKRSQEPSSCDDAKPSE